MRISCFKKATLMPIILACLVSIVSVPSSLGYQPAGAFNEGSEIAGKNTLLKIVSTLAIRNPDRKVLDKATEKLSAMNDRDFRLIAALCNRIPADGVTAGADIAFSLITAMIILS